MKNFYINKTDYNRILKSKTEKNSIWNNIIIVDGEAFIVDNFRAVKAPLSVLKDDAITEACDISAMTEADARRVKGLTDRVKSDLRKYANCEIDYKWHYINVESFIGKFKELKASDSRYNINYHPVLFKLDGTRLGDVYMNAEYLMQVLKIFREKTIRVSVATTKGFIIIGDNSENGIVAVMCARMMADLPTFSIEDVDNYEPPKVEEEPIEEVTPDTKLMDVKSKAETKRFIMYNKQQTKAVYHKKLVRKIADNLYVGEVESDGWYKSCAIYIHFDNCEAGLILGNINAEETVKETVERVRENTLEGMRAWFEQEIKNDHWIRLTEIEFMKMCMPDLEEGAWKARENHKKRLDAQKAEHEAERDRKKQETYEEGKAEAEKELEEITSIIKNGGDVTNKTITIYRKTSDVGERFNYTSSSYSIFNYLFRQYGINVPIKTQGFINDRLHTVTFGKKGISWNYYRNGKSQGSKTIGDYLIKLMNAVRAA